MSKIKLFIAPFDFTYQKATSVQSIKKLKDYQLFFSMLATKTSIEIIDGIEKIDSILDSYDALNIKYGTQKADAFYLYCLESVRECDIIVCFYPESYSLIAPLADRYGKTLHYFIPPEIDIDEFLKTVNFYPFFSSFFSVIYDSDFSCFIYNLIETEFKRDKQYERPKKKDICPG